MTLVEAIVEAIKLLIVAVGYAIEEAKKHEQTVLDAKTKRAMFEAAVLRALADTAPVTKEKAQADDVDQAVDKLLGDDEKTPPGGDFPPHG